MQSRLRYSLVACLSGVILCFSAGGLAVAEEQAEESSASHAVSFEYGVGYDSNPFLSPGDSYYDQNAGSVIQPLSTSGFFAPLRLDGLLTTRHSFVAYGLDGDLYPDSQTRNAENYELRVATGVRLDLGSEHDRTLQIGPYAVQNKEVYFDRDTGLANQSGGIDVSDRFAYRGLGGALELDLEANRRLDLSLTASAERRDYESVEGLEPFDHDVIEAGARVGVRLARAASFYVGYEHQSRAYEQRHARDLTGDSSDANPLLEYTYESQELGLRFRNSRRWRLFLGWERTERTDEYLGYNDYLQDRYRLRTSFGKNRWTLELFGGYRERSFPRAFIFDNPTSPQDGTPNPVKNYDRVDYGFETEIAWNHFRLVIGAQHEDQETSDPRFSYLRSRVMIGGRWVF